MVRYSMIVDGRVQGVGFRYFTQMEAFKLELTGWVKNLIDDKVEIEVQGPEEKVFKFIASVKRGNGFSRIDDIELNNISVVPDEKKYRIAY